LLKENNESKDLRFEGPRAGEIQKLRLFLLVFYGKGLPIFFTAKAMRRFRKKPERNHVIIFFNRSSIP